jgi:Ca2+-binding RTX toxin-like protein
MTATTISSLNDSDQNDITLRTISGSIDVGTVDAGTRGDVILDSAAGISGGLLIADDLVGPVMADDLTINAQGAVSLSTTVNDLFANLTVAGAIEIAETDAIVLESVQTMDGAIEVTAAGQIVATNVQAGGGIDDSVALLTSAGGVLATSVAAADSVLVNADTGDILVGSISAASGSVGVTAGGGSINDAGDDAVQDISAGTTISLFARDEIGGLPTAGTASDQSGRLELAAGSNVSAVSTAAGDIVLRGLGALNLGDATTADGSIDVVAAGDLVATHLLSETDSDANDISLFTSAGTITIGSVDAGALGDVFLQTPSYISGGQVSADQLLVIAGDYISLNTSVNRFEGSAGSYITITESDDILVNDPNDVAFTAVSATIGPISFTAGGDITAGSLLLQTGGNAITLDAQGDITIVAEVDAGSTGSVDLVAGNNVTGSTVTAGLLSIDAGGAIDLETTVANLVATAGGAIKLVEFDDIDLLDVHGGIGAINLNSGGAVTLTDVDTLDGPIAVVADGDITAVSVVSLTDSDANDISLTSTGGSIFIEPGTADAGAAGDVYLTASGDVLGLDGVPGVHVFADLLSVEAGGLIDLDTTVSTLVASAGTKISIDETGAIVLADVETANGSIGVTAGVSIEATSVVSQTDGNAVTLQAQDDIAIVEVDAGAAGYAELIATSGNVTGGLVTAGILSVDAGGAIDLETTVANLVAVAGGAITIDESDAIELASVHGGAGEIAVSAGGAVILTDVDTINGSIDIMAAGAIDAIDVQAGGAGDDVDLSTTGGGIEVASVIAAGSVRLEAATGDVNVDSVIATAGSIDIEATAGAINEKGSDAAADLTAGATILLASKDEIGDDPVNGKLEFADGSDIEARSTVAGNIGLQGLGVLVLRDIETADGRIDAIAGSDMTVVSVVSLADAVGNDIALDAAGDITIEAAVDAGTAGNVSLIALGNISGGLVTADLLAAHAGGTIELETTVENLLATAGGGITLDETDAIELADVHAGIGAIAVTAGGAIILTDVDTLNGSIAVTAAGAISAVDVQAAGSGSDVELISTGGGIEAALVVAVDSVVLEAAGDVGIDSILATTGSIEVTAIAGAIDEKGDDAAADLTAGTTIVLTAQDEIGDPDKLELADGSDVEAHSTMAGHIGLLGLGALTLRDVDTIDGSIDVMAAGAIDAIDVQASGSGRDISLAATVGGIEATFIVADDSIQLLAAAGDVDVDSLIATAGSIDVAATAGAINEKGSDAAADLTAGSTIVLTAQDEIGDPDELELADGSDVEAHSTMVGNIGLRGLGALTLTDVDTADGSIYVIAAGDITVVSVVSLTDSDANDITLESTGGSIIILPGTVDAGAAGDVALNALGDVTGYPGMPGVHVHADALAVDAGGLIDLDTTVKLLMANAGTDITIDESDDIELTGVQSDNGAIDIVAGGDIDLISVSIGTDTDDNDISITSVAGSITAGSIAIDTGLNGDVVLDAAMASVSLNDPIVAEDLDVFTRHLIVDYDGITPFPSGDFVFTGTGVAGDPDTLTVFNGNVDSVTYQYTGPNSGEFVIVDGNDTQVIQHLNIEIVNDNLVADERTLEMSDGADTIVLSDNDDPDDGISRLTNNDTGLSIDFINPDSDLVLHMRGGADHVIANDIDPAFAGDVIIHGDAGNDLIDASTSTYGYNLSGGADHDLLRGGYGVDTIRGDAGEDVIVGGADSDRLDGGAGRDLIFGDEVLLERTGDWTNPRYRTLSGDQIYNTDTASEFAGEAQITGGEQDVPGGPADWENFNFILENNDSSDGDDYIAGGADDDQIFGQLGDDTIQGDGSIDLSVGAMRDALTGMLTVSASEGKSTDGDDYIEGNGGDDIIFGNLGQDDIIGGSSELFSLTDPNPEVAATLRPDGSDIIFGGSGDAIDRNSEGDGLHGRDSDMILGDNGNIFRIVGTAGFNYDDGYDEAIVVRAAELIDYTPGGPDMDPAAEQGDNGAGDEIHGESGDDFVYGMTADDILFGEAGDDDLIGGWGNEWISGGTGQDGILGDDGRIFTSRNGMAEPLYGIAATTEEIISTPGDIQYAVINPTGQLMKSVDLTPFNPVAGGYELSDPQFADDIIYGGLDSDWLHGGAGDDAMSGAEALELYYDNPFNPGDVLRFSEVTGEFAEYDEFEPRLEIFYGANGGDAPDGYEIGAPFLLNFDPAEGMQIETGTIWSDGDDALFGDLGNDWLVGGTGRDNMYGGWGDDLLNADDDHTTNTVNDIGLNDGPDTYQSYEDRAFGGAGRDRLIANTGGDRLIDWAGNFNSYIVPFSQYGMGTVSRTLQPKLAEFLYDLSAGDGADFTRGGDPERNGEPDGELGVVRNQDFAWHDQTGASNDPQVGNIPGGPRDVLRSADFDTAQGSTFGTGFFADSGVFEASGGELRVGAASQGDDAVAIYHVGEQLPLYFELTASVKFDKGTGGWDGNAYMIFDYQGENDFKFVGIDDKVNKLVMGHRDSSGWHVDNQASVSGGIKPDKWYNMLIAVNGLNVTLVVDNSEVFQHTYDPRVVDGYAYALNWGLVGMGSNNARGSFDNVRVQILPPQITLEETEDFDDGQAQQFTGESAGTWTVDNQRYDVVPTGELGLSIVDLGPDNLNFNSYLELNVDVKTSDMAGLIFDRYGDESFKFAAIDRINQQLVIGHYTQKAGWAIDETMAATILDTEDYTLDLTLKGNTVNVTLNDPVNGGYQAIASEIFYSSTVDGNFGLFSKGGAASFDNLEIKTDDQAFVEALVAEDGEIAGGNAAALTPEELTPIVASAIEYWRVAGYDVSAIEGMTVEIADLPGALLGLVRDDTVYIDVDAAGHGWFVDSTPFASEEYSVNGDGTLSAIAGSGAEGHMDLMTVVVHELGHALGFVHDDSELMDTSLSAGAREVSDTDITSASSEVIESLDHYNILVTSSVEWNEPGFVQPPQNDLPDSIDNNQGSAGVQAESEAQQVLVFDEESGEFIEIENANPDTSSASLPETDDTIPGDDDDWLVISDLDSDSASSAGDSSASGTPSIVWNAGSEEVNDLLAPPPPGNSGNSRGKGANAN